MTLTDGLLSRLSALILSLLSSLTVIYILGLSSCLQTGITVLHWGDQLAPMGVKEHMDGVVLPSNGATHGTCNGGRLGKAAGVVPARDEEMSTPCSADVLQDTQPRTSERSNAEFPFPLRPQGPLLLCQAISRREVHMRHSLELVKKGLQFWSLWGRVIQSNIPVSAPKKEHLFVRLSISRYGHVDVFDQRATAMEF